MIFNKQNNMTPAKARLKLAVHAGETENFAGGYRYALKYGFCNLEDMIQKFDEIFICLKLLNETGRLAQIDRELLTQLSELLWGKRFVYKQSENTFPCGGYLCGSFVRNALLPFGKFRASF